MNTAEAANVEGIFCNWNFNKAVVEWLTDIYGNGQQAVKVKRNGTLESSPLPFTLRNLSFQVWSENYQTRVTTRYKAENSSSWTIIPSNNGKSTEIISPNSTATLSISGDLVIENLTPGNSSDSNIITISASSNNIVGYEAVIPAQEKVPAPSKIENQKDVSHPGKE